MRTSTVVDLDDDDDDNNNNNGMNEFRLIESTCNRQEERQIFKLGV